MCVSRGPDDEAERAEGDEKKETYSEKEIVTRDSLDGGNEKILNHGFGGTKLSEPCLC